MSEEKQIEEMAKQCHFCEKGKCLLLGDEAVDCDTECDIGEFAKSLYNIGYRKQSEGEWGFDGMSWTCSECNEYATKGIRTSFCPNCGAKMKGGE